MIKEIFGVKFINGSYKIAFSRLLKKQFMVVPSGPGLSVIDKDVRYYNALKSADFAIPDSGFMIILLRLFFNIRIKKLSGPKFLRKFLNEDVIRKPNKLFLIDPNRKESLLNKEYLNRIGVPISSEYQYIAPYYGGNKINDKDLIDKLNTLQEKPEFILVNLGGGIQEPLGLYIKDNITYRTAIICTGAAIAFQTGSQAKIPDWVDAIYLGWFARIIQNPTLFFMRFLKAFRLVYVFYLCKRNKIK